MVDSDAHVRAYIGEEAIGAAIEIIAGNDFVAGLEQTQDDI